ncbi:hypothetical protein [Acidovorax sp. A1169]|uniref:hypothetical protein n=1 Tax=Acidovorax sp. A1169 TaxID=3059524 RepID=UPI002737B2ED|nr:hypothetical protein [Acidovorax sp. A1169]MDP4077210.1 hypothetical protein [Acidovorax sp. A1169]
MPLKIVLLGAPATGAQDLADALAAHLAATPSPTPVTLTVLADFSALDQTASMALLMGLDLPCPLDQQPAQQAADAQLRAALNAAGVAYRVVYGTGPARLASALRALGAVLGMPESDAVQANESRAARLRAYGCEKCSDPVCEHRLFTALTRPPAPGCA